MSQNDDRTGADTGEMVQAQKKPTVEYNGYKRTITDVLRIIETEDNGDPAGVSVLMKGLDQAIKDCRVLRRRLERLHKKRNTGYYQRLQINAS